MTVADPALVEHRFGSMGTEVAVIVPHALEHAIAAARATFDDWDRRFSRFDPRSELSLLNRTAGSERAAFVSQELLAAVNAAIDAAVATDGLFDPLLGARMVELGYDRSFERLDPAGRGDDPLSAWVAGQWRSIRVDGAASTVGLPPGTALDLGGIAKGMAVDAALGAIVSLGVPYAAVSAGGDLAVHGRLPDDRAWTVAIDELTDRTMAMTHGAMATSSVRRRRWQTAAGERHHLLDPRTGLPAASGLSQVSVVAATCTQAEVGAKAALLLGPDAAPVFLERRGLHGLLVTDDGLAVKV